MAIAVNKEMQCTLERNIISMWADLEWLNLIRRSTFTRSYDSLKPDGLCDLSM